MTVLNFGKARLRQQGCNIVRLIPAMLEQQPAARAQHCRSLRDDGADIFQPIGTAGQSR